MGEIGGQADIYYTFRKGSTLGGKRGLKGARQLRDFTIRLKRVWAR